jgi:hypothetical protein
MTTTELQDKAITAFEEYDLQQARLLEDRVNKADDEAKKAIGEIFPEAVFLEDERKFQLCGYKFEYYSKNYSPDKGRDLKTSHYLKGVIDNHQFMIVNNLVSLGKFLLTKGVSKSFA